MKANLNTVDLSIKNKSKKKSKFPDEKMKVFDSIDPDAEFESQLQNEVKLFLNGNAQLENNRTKKKKSKKQNDIDKDSNNFNELKLLNQNKYSAKLLKKTKLKENNLKKLEKRNKKRKALKENNAVIQSNVDISVDHTINLAEEEMLTDFKLKSHIKEKNEKIAKVLTGKISKKKEEKMKQYEMKRLFRKFDNMDISQDRSDDAHTPGKRGRNKCRKLKKKEKLLRVLLKENKKSDCNLNESDSQLGRKRPSIETLKKQIESLKKEQPRPKKAKKTKIHNAVDNQMELDPEKYKQKTEKKNKGDKEKKKKKKSKRNVDSENDSPMKKLKLGKPQDEEMEECNMSGNRVEPVEPESQSCGVHKKEKHFNSKHTPLRERLMNKLKAARFR